MRNAWQQAAASSGGDWQAFRREKGTGLRRTQRRCPGAPEEATERPPHPAAAFLIPGAWT